MEYQKAYVEDAPGWEDFTGVLIMSVRSIDDRLMHAVGWEEPDGKQDFHLFEDQYVTIWDM